MAEETTTNKKTVLLMLGGFKFEARISSYDELVSTVSWAWNESKRSKSTPSLQFQSKNLQTIKIKGFLSTVESGLKSFESLENEANKGEPLSLIDGLGNVHGLFVVESLSRTYKDLIFEGIARGIDFEIELKAYA